MTMSGIGDIIATPGAAGGPPSADAFKRAVYRAAPRNFAVEVLGPKKHGGSYSYGLRIVPLLSDKLSVKSSAAVVEYDVWRKWEDCLWFQDTLEMEYAAMSKAKRERLVRGEGVLKSDVTDIVTGESVYANTHAAASFESLPPGPDPSSVAKHVRDLLPQLTKKGTFFRASLATVSQRQTEFEALITALFVEDCPSILKELRSTRTVRDFFGFWRRDHDLALKLGTITPAVAKEAKRSSVASSLYTLASPSMPSLPLSAPAPTATNLQTHLAALSPINPMARPPPVPPLPPLSPEARRKGPPVWKEAPVPVSPTGASHGPAARDRRGRLVDPTRPAAALYPDPVDARVQYTHHASGSRPDAHAHAHARAVPASAPPASGSFSVNGSGSGSAAVSLSDDDSSGTSSASIPPVPSPWQSQTPTPNHSQSRTYAGPSGQKLRHAASGDPHGWRYGEPIVVPQDIRLLYSRDAEPGRPVSALPMLPEEDHAHAHAHRHDRYEREQVDALHHSFSSDFLPVEPRTAPLRSDDFGEAVPPARRRRTTSNTLENRAHRQGRIFDPQNSVPVPVHDPYAAAVGGFEEPAEAQDDAEGAFYVPDSFAALHRASNLSSSSSSRFDGRMSRIGKRDSGSSIATGSSSRHTSWRSSASGTVADVKIALGLARAYSPITLHTPLAQPQLSPHGHHLQERRLSPLAMALKPNHSSPDLLGGARRSAAGGLGLGLGAQGDGRRERTRTRGEERRATSPPPPLSLSAHLHRSMSNGSKRGGALIREDEEDTSDREDEDSLIDHYMYASPRHSLDVLPNSHSHRNSLRDSRSSIPSPLPFPLSASIPHQPSRSSTLDSSSSLASPSATSFVTLKAVCGDTIVVLRVARDARLADVRRRLRDKLEAQGGKVDEGVVFGYVPIVPKDKLGGKTDINGRPRSGSVASGLSSASGGSAELGSLRPLGTQEQWEEAVVIASAAESKLTLRIVDFEAA